MNIAAFYLVRRNAETDVKKCEDTLSISRDSETFTC